VDDQTVPVPEAAPAPVQMPMAAFEFSYKQFAFKLDDNMTCEPKRVGEYLTDQALGSWAPRQISEHVHDGWLIVAITMMRLKNRRIIPAAQIPTVREEPRRR
jgi:hypothetical protein